MFSIKLFPTCSVCKVLESIEEILQRICMENIDAVSLMMYFIALIDFIIGIIT